MSHKSINPINQLTPLLILVVAISNLPNLPNLPGFSMESSHVASSTLCFTSPGAAPATLAEHTTMVTMEIKASVTSQIFQGAVFAGLAALETGSSWEIKMLSTLSSSMAGKTQLWRSLITKKLQRLWVLDNSLDVCLLQFHSHPKTHAGKRPNQRPNQQHISW